MTYDKKRLYSVCPECYISTFEVNIQKKITTYRIFHHQIIPGKKKSRFKSLELGFLILFLRKAGLPRVSQQELKTRQWFMYPCRLFSFFSNLMTHLHSAYLLRLLQLQKRDVGFSSVTASRCCCCCCWVASLYDEWGKAVVRCIYILYIHTCSNRRTPTAPHYTITCSDH